MGYILCTAEKPSVASDIARVIGANIKKRGYYEGNGYRVTWAVGHLVGLAEPENYGYMSLNDIWGDKDTQTKQKAIEELPLIPNNFKLVVLDKTKEQFEIMKSLMNDPECISIIDCGDCGAEGHILQWFIRVKAGCNKEVKRFMATSMTDEAIREAMENLHDINTYMPIIKGEYCKKKADWIMGISMSRAASIIYNAKVDVGRVQSPTLFFVVKRYLDTIQFKSKEYYELKASMLNGMDVYWLKDTDKTFSSDSIDEEKRLLDKRLAEKMADEIMHMKYGKITVFETKNRTTDRPQLYDITELERDGNRIFGYTAEEVLRTAQSLYETYKITTYPRTDSRYLTHDLVDTLGDKIVGISFYPQYEEVCHKLLSHGLNIDSRIVDDSKVTDHHAIIVTDKIADFDFSRLSEMEEHILNLIIVRMLVAFSEKYRYKETIINIKFDNGINFGASEKVEISKGWKDTQAILMRKISEDEKVDVKVSREEKHIFENIELGMTVEVKSVEVIPKKTMPPLLHTEATLLTAMENAGAFIENGAILKGKGIGTQATRANIIKQLFEKGYIMNQKKGKTNYLIPTKQGISVIKVLPCELYSPKITADWESQIADIVSGKITEKDFMDNFKIFIVDKLNKILTQKVTNVDFSIDKVSLGKCLWCKSPVFEGCYKDDEGNKIESVYCSNKQCKFSMRRDNLTFKMRTKKNISMSQMKDLISGKTIECKCISKANSSYNGQFKIIQNAKGYADLMFLMPTFKEKKKNK